MSFGALDGHEPPSRGATPARTAGGSWSTPSACRASTVRIRVGPFGAAMMMPNPSDGLITRHDDECTSLSRPTGPVAEWFSDRAWRAVDPCRDTTRRVHVARKKASQTLISCGEGYGARACHRGTQVRILPGPSVPVGTDCRPRGATAGPAVPEKDGPTNPLFFRGGKRERPVNRCDPRNYAGSGHRASVSGFDTRCPHL